MTPLIVTVQYTVSGNKYFIDGVRQPPLSLILGDSIVFNQYDSSNTGHPLRIYDDEYKTTEVTEGVSVSGSSVTFKPTRVGSYSYQCQLHDDMGYEITVLPVPLEFSVKPYNELNLTAEYSNFYLNDVITNSIDIPLNEVMEIPLSYGIAIEDITIIDEDGNSIDTLKTEYAELFDDKIEYKYYNQFRLDDAGEYTLSLKSNPDATLTLNAKIIGIDGEIRDPDSDIYDVTRNNSTPCDGEIKSSDFQDVFGGSHPISISEYYGAADGVPSSGEIKFSDLVCKSAFEPPVLTSPGNLNRSSAYDGDSISVNNASFRQGTDPASLQYSWEYTRRSNSAITNGSWSSSRIITANDYYSRVRANVRAKVTGQDIFSNTSFTNYCTINTDPNDCGNGGWSNPTGPVDSGVAAGPGKVTINLNQYWGNYGDVIYWCGFGKDLIEWPDGAIGDRNGCESGWISRPGRSFTIDSKTSQPMKFIWALVPHISGRPSWSGGSGTSHFPAGNGKVYPSEPGGCKGNVGVVVWEGACVFDQTGPAISLSDGTAGSTVGDSYMKMNIKFFRQTGWPRITWTANANNSSKFIQCAGGHHTMQSS